MDRKRLGNILIILGVGIAILVAIVVYMQVSRAAQVEALLPQQQVVVAINDIPARTEIAAKDVNLVAVPNDLLQVGAATKIEDVVGKFSPGAMIKGQVINTQQIGPLSEKNAPSFTIQPGMVMYVMPVSFAGTVFSIAEVNALRAGDRVDLLYTTINAPAGLTSDQQAQILANPIPFLQTRVMLQNLRIQQIGQYADDGTLIPATSGTASSAATTNTTAPTGSTLEKSNIIFIVTPEQALVLKWLKDAATYYKQSNIEMVLRSPADQTEADPNLVVNFNYMQQKYNLAPPPVLTEPQK